MGGKSYEEWPGEGKGRRSGVETGQTRDSARDSDMLHPWCPMHHHSCCGMNGGKGGVYCSSYIAVICLGAESVVDECPVGPLRAGVVELVLRGRQGAPRPVEVIPPVRAPRV